jgi:hypothetical protein
MHTNAIVRSHQNSYQAEKHQTVRSPGREFAEKCAHAYCSFTKLLHRRRPPWGSHMRCVQSASRLLNYVSARRPKGIHTNRKCMSGAA